MSTNYNSTAVGVPYIRACNITIQYPDSGIPTITIEQEKAVKLADNSIVRIGSIPSIEFSLNIADNTTQIPLVDPTSGSNIGLNTTTQMTMLAVLAIIRQQQLLQNP